MSIILQSEKSLNSEKYHFVLISIKRVRKPEFCLRVGIIIRYEQSFFKILFHAIIFHKKEEMRTVGKLKLSNFSFVIEK